jgi:DNA polymerase-3 subunit delta'
LDRILVDLLALYRDVLTVQLKAQTPLVNRDLSVQIREVAYSSKPEDTIGIIDMIEKSRDRIDRNVRDIYVMDSLAATLKRRA